MTECAMTSQGLTPFILETKVKESGHIVNKKEVQVFTFGLTLSGIATVFLPMLISGTANFNIVFSVFGGALITSGIVFGLFFLRCPHCRISLVFRGLSSNFCPRCGKGFHAE